MHNMKALSGCLLLCRVAAAPARAQDAEVVDRYYAAALEYKCAPDVVERRPGHVLYMGDGPCKVLVCYGEGFTVEHVYAGDRREMIWHYRTGTETGPKTFWFSWDDALKRWVLTNAVIHKKETER